MAIRPLYEQVLDEFVRRIVSREWQAGTVIPNEMDLARDLGVSLGTVRKAFASLSEMQMVMRVPGKGTTVVDQVENATSHRFINTRDRAGAPILGDLHIVDPRIVEATPDLAAVFGLPVDSRILRFTRHRTYRERIFTFEVVHIPVVPGDVLSEAERARRLWFDHDITVEKAERIAMTAASEADAEAFRIDPGTALLNSERLIYGYRGRVLEHRIGNIHLGSDLTFMIGPPDRRLSA